MCAYLGQAQFNDDELLDFLNDSKPTGATESVSSIRSSRYACAARAARISPSVSYTPAPLFPKPSAPLARPPQTKPAPKSLSASFGDPAPVAEPPGQSSPVVSRFLAPLSPAPSEPPRAPPSPAPQHARNPSREIAPASAEAADAISLLDSPVPPSPASSAPPAASASSAAVGTGESVAALRNQRDQVEMANRMLKSQMKELNGELQEVSERTRAASAAAEKAMEQVCAPFWWLHLIVSLPSRRCASFSRNCKSVRRL